MYCDKTIIDGGPRLGRHPSLAAATATTVELLGGCATQARILLEEGDAAGALRVLREAEEIKEGWYGAVGDNLGAYPNGHLAGIARQIGSDLARHGNR